MEEKRLEENRQLRERLDRMLSEARRNEKTQNSFDDFSLSVVAAQGPRELFHLLLEKQKEFRVDEIRLCILDRYHEHERLLTESYQYQYPGLNFLDQDSCQQYISTIPDNPVLGQHVVSKYADLMGLDDNHPYRSAALLPLKRGDRVIGIQFLLSRDENRYSKDFATLLLQRLAAMIAISIENCINRQRTLEMGYQDGLTSAYNRRYFDERIKHEIERCLRNRTDLVCLFLDIDHFKQINDNYGHQVGDAVLIRLVTLMSEQVRSSDIVARYGGEEFAIILPDTGIQIAHEIAERIRKLVAGQKLIINDNTLSTTVSIGISSLSQIKYQNGLSDARQLQTLAGQLDQLLLKKADEALYLAKESGRNKVVIKKANKNEPLPVAQQKMNKE